VKLLFASFCGYHVSMPLSARAWLVAAALALCTTPAGAQQWNPGTRAADWLSTESGGKLALNYEWRFRYESRTDGFGATPDIATGLMRTRISLTYAPAQWLKFSGMVQDSRAFWYGGRAPNSVRDTADLQEGYVQIAGKSGPGVTVGRQMLVYGEGRLIGIGQWSNVSRTFDAARAYYRGSRGRIEFLFASPVQVRTDEFNTPVLGQRLWGPYATWQAGKQTVEGYILRRDQNRPGGFTGGNRADGTDSAHVNTYGARAAGPLPDAMKYSVEIAAQTGRVGTAEHRAAAWYAGIGRRWEVANRPLDLWGEFKYASGTGNPADASRTSTFDPLFPSNHDKFGHQDLFGWRNFRGLKAVATYAPWKDVTLNLFFNDSWLASRRDALYSSAGRAIAQSVSGDAGRHIGKEVDLFGSYRFESFTFGAGFGRLFAGEFVRRAAPGASPNYLYVFQTYSR
jgi:hypothetical protein